MPTETTDIERRRGARVVRIVGVLLLLGAVIAVVFAIIAVAESQHFEARAVATDGVLTGTERVTTDGGTRKAPVFSYRDQSGKTWQVTDSLSGDFTQGRHVKVYYRQTDPGRGSLDPAADSGMAGFFLIVAVVTLGMGIWTIRVGGKIARGDLGAAPQNDRH